MKFSWPKAVLFGLSIGVLGASTPLWSGFEGHYRRARQAIERGEWQSAIEFLTRALAKNEQAGVAMRGYGVSFEPYLPNFYLGLAHFELGNYHDALWAWETAEREGAVLESSHAARFRDLRQQAELASIDTPRPPQVASEGAGRLEDSAQVAEGSVSITEEFHSDASGGLAVAVSGQDFGLIESRALVVGVSNYGSRSAWPSLPGVQEDVVAVEEALRRHGFQVDVLRDPTKEKLVDAMEDFFYIASRSEATRMIFYYAGHGATVESNGVSRGYIVPVDAPSHLTEPQLFRRSAISMARFQEYAAEASARHLLFLFDSCFSGAVFDVVRSAGVSGSALEKIKEPSRMFIAAGDADQEVPDKSYFRRAFVEALDGAADLNADGVIFGVEVGQFIADEVTNRFYSTPDRQTPRWGRSGDFARGDIPFQSSGVYELQLRAVRGTPSEGPHH